MANHPFNRDEARLAIFALSDMYAGSPKSQEALARLTPTIEAFAQQSRNQEEATQLTSTLGSLSRNPPNPHPMPEELRNADRRAVEALGNLISSDNHFACLAALDMLTTLHQENNALAKTAMTSLVPRIIELLDRRIVAEGTPLRTRCLNILEAIGRDIRAVNHVQAQAAMARFRPPPLPIVRDPAFGGRMPPPPLGHHHALPARPPARLEAYQRMSRMSYQDEVDLLRREKEQFATSQVDLDNLLQPTPEAELRIMDRFTPPDEDLARNWESYRGKLEGLVARLPAAAFGTDGERTRDLMRRRLTDREFSAGAWPGSLFDKSTQTAEARSPEGRKKIQRLVASSINYLEELQRAGEHGIIYRVLQNAAPHAEACPDRAIVGINTLGLHIRLLAKQRGGEADQDGRALMTLRELVQQAKLNFVRSETLLRHAGREGEILVEAYVIQCLVFKDVLGLDFAANEMLYQDCGEAAMRMGRDFGRDLHAIMRRLSDVDDLLGFMVMPPEDSELSSFPQWQTITTAPIEELSRATEGRRSQLLSALLRPILQALGYIKGPPLAELIRQAQAGDPQAITVLYWMKLNRNEQAFEALQTIPARPDMAIEVLGILAKSGNRGAKTQLEDKVTEAIVQYASVNGALEQLSAGEGDRGAILASLIAEGAIPRETQDADMDQALDQRRQALLTTVSKIARYDIPEAVDFLLSAPDATSLWTLAQMDARSAKDALQRLYNENNEEAIATIDHAQDEGDPLAIQIATAAPPQNQAAAQQRAQRRAAARRAQEQGGGGIDDPAAAARRRQVEELRARIAAQAPQQPPR